MTCTRNQLYDITEAIACTAKNVFDSKLDSVLLYGSYARGEETKDSDIDIMVLVDASSEEISAYKKIFTSLTSELGLMHDTVITVTLKDTETFNRYLDAVPFYQNVKREGVSIAV